MKLKKVLAILTACAILAGFTTILASAENTISNGSIKELETELVFEPYYDEERELFVIDETDYYDENGYHHISRLYTSEDPNGMTINSTSGGPSLYASFKTVNSNNGTRLVSFYTGGMFSWDGQTAWVTDVFGDIEFKASNVTITSETLTYGSHQGSNFLFGNKYAFTGYLMYFQTSSGQKFDGGAYIEVNRNGVSKFI